MTHHSSGDKRKLAFQIPLQLCCPSLDTILNLNVLPLERDPTLNAACEVQPPQCLVLLKPIQLTIDHTEPTDPSLYLLAALSSESSSREQTQTAPAKFHFLFPISHLKAAARGEGCMLCSRALQQSFPPFFWLELTPSPIKSLPSQIPRDLLAVSPALADVRVADQEGEDALRALNALLLWEDVVDPLLN